MEAIDQNPWERNVKRQCPVCNVSYLAAQKRLERGKQTTCSRGCSYILRGREKQTGVVLVCGVCRNEFARSAAKVKGKHGFHFCSPTCHYQGRSLGLSRRVVYKPYNHTNQGRANRSKAAARAYASGKTLTFPKTELAVVRALREAGVTFVHQKVVEMPDRAFAVDFFFPKLNLIVELDRPDCHKRTKAHYDFERDQLLTALGFGVVRLWDNGRPENAVRAVLATLLQHAK